MASRAPDRRTVCGLLFPFGLGMVIATGAELFTGNCLITISLLGWALLLAGDVAELEHRLPV